MTPAARIAAEVEAHGAEGPLPEEEPEEDGDPAEHIACPRLCRKADVHGDMYPLSSGNVAGCL